MSQRLVELPSIYTKSLRGRVKIDFNRPNTYLTVGLRGSGKSSLLEAVGLHYKKIIDLFSSRDNEGLAWCRSPLATAENILFVTGDSTIIESQWDSKKISELRLRDFKNYRIIITVPAFYVDMEEEYRAYDRFVKLLYSRIVWTKLWYLLIREAANFIYSRIKIVKNQEMAKADFIHTLREGRHVGLAIGVDTIRWTSIDKELRDICDYFFIKRVGSIGLPDELHFIYKYVDPRTLMNLPPSHFVVMTNTGGIGLGLFDYPKWHKEEGEPIIKKLGISIMYGDKINYGNTNRNTLGDPDHSELITKYTEIKSMARVGEQMNRSPGTVHYHIRQHNAAVKRNGVCDRCERVNNP